jgi:radical SAM superfamily enzyme YgiQ (UPF0313 family)
MSKVLLVYPLIRETAPIRLGRGDIYEGISLIAAMLKKHGHEVQLYVLGCRPLESNWPYLNEMLDSFQPDIVGFTAFAPTYPFAVQAARYVRGKRSDAFVVIGGPHATLNPQQCIDDGFDAVCIGEGEHPMVELAAQLNQQLTPDGIANLWIADHSTGAVQKNTPRPFQENLDELPFADRTVWKQYERTDGYCNFKVTLGRGCPFNCTYCSNHALRKVASGRYVRMRSPEHVIEEIRSLYTDNPAMRELYLEVETISSVAGYAEQLCNTLQAFNRELTVPIEFGCNLRVTPTLDAEEIFAHFKRANIVWVAIGLESGSERVRREVLKRHYSNQDIERVNAAAAKYGIKLYFYNLIGLPGETWDDYLQTIEVNRRCRPWQRQVSIFYPYPGTELYRVCEEMGVLRKRRDANGERVKAQLDFPSFSKVRIQKAYEYFDYHVEPTAKRWLQCTFKKYPRLLALAWNIKQMVRGR